MMLRKVEFDELHKIEEIAHEFYSSTDMLNGFDLGAFMETWTTIYMHNMGIVYGLFDNSAGELYGVIGGIKFQDPNSYAVLAQEMFWYVKKDRRGAGLALLKRFEQWAREEGCSGVIMVHLSDLMPDVVKNIYEKCGYSQTETAYRKELR